MYLCGLFKSVKDGDIVKARINSPCPDLVSGSRLDTTRSQSELTMARMNPAEEQEEVRTH